MLSLAGYYGLVGAIIYGIILPIDFHIFQDGSKTTNQWAIDGISTNITGICSIDI
jgi:hypothetical protein